MQTKNNLTLIIDANWLLISRASVLIKSFNTELPDEAKKQAQSELEDLLAKSICVILNRIPVVDNVVIVADGGSWRKQLTVPNCIEGTIYKGNRTKTNETDWNYIYNSLNSIVSNSKREGITVSQYANIEGDDWVWYWSRRLNNEGTNCIIWTSDNDLKQLVQIDENTHAFTAWYNDKNGLWLPESINKGVGDSIDFFMNVQYYSPTLESIKARISQINYVNPDSIVMSKVICGDAGDNILPIARYNKNNKTYRITEKDWGELNNIECVNKFIKQRDEIVDDIINHKKFKQHKLSKDNLHDQFDYNVKLVWLNESVIPDTIIQFMNQQEYKLIDINYLRSNYKVLLNTDNYIQNLFDF